MTEQTLGDRMKRYEEVWQTTLAPRSPVIIRVDGKNFSKLTRKMQKPFDTSFASCMRAAALELAKEAQSCRLAYYQSDEISLLLTPFKKTTTNEWFENRVQKLCSVAAAVATVGFAKEFVRLFPAIAEGRRLPIFDARCFVIPTDDVSNYFVWRQRDCIRNSITMAAQAHFSANQLHALNGSQKLELLREKGVEWESFDNHFKGGSIVTRSLLHLDETSVRSKWESAPAPDFVAERDLIERQLRVEDKQ